jgi:phosphopantothenoylcysteine decarboxylase / phosphopantothenate---cysteine ligase
VFCKAAHQNRRLLYNRDMRVTVGVSGGIAAYKAAELVRALQRQAIEVRVVMTAAAQRFVQPLTFAALTGHRVQTGLWDEPASEGPTPEQNGIDHIAEAQWADALVVAPATANILAKFAHGIADDFLTTLYLATTAPVLVAPAMNVNMWDHPATRANLELLRQRGVRVVEPGTGDLACGMVGAGRMAEPDAIAAAVLSALNCRHDLAGEVVLVTAGGTREAIDPVRFLGNGSSGKMGYALADAAQSRGARVILVSGPSALHAPARCELVKVTTAEEMRNAVLKRAVEATLVIKAAAVADYRPVLVSDHKLKRSGPLTLELTPTEDILAEVVKQRRPGQLIVGFAAETENQMENGRAKLLRKGADAIVVNDAAGENVGIDSETNAATFLTSTTAIELPLMLKRQLADRILDEILTLRRPRPVVLELDGHEDAPTRAERAEQEHRDRERMAEEETIVTASSRRQLIVE